MFMLLSYISLPDEVKLLANESMGHAVLSSLFVYGYEYECVTRIDNGDIIGFALYHKHAIWKYRVGVIDCVCVSIPYRGSGVGAELFFAVLKKMGDVDRVETTVHIPRSIDTWPGIPVCGNTDFLTRLGFREVVGSTMEDDEWKKCVYAIDH